MLQMFRLCLLVVTFALAVQPASAAFSVCNKTTHPLLVAIARPSAGGWVSEGWWRVEASACADILQGPLKARYYYLRGVHLGVDGAWDGNRFFCIAADNFVIKGRDKCKKRGYGQAGFFEVDTLDKASWVQNLSD